MHFSAKISINDRCLCATLDFQNRRANILLQQCFCYLIVTTAMATALKVKPSLVRTLFDYFRGGFVPSGLASVSSDLRRWANLLLFWQRRKQGRLIDHESQRKNFPFPLQPRPCLVEPFSRRTRAAQKFFDVCVFRWIDEHCFLLR